jgi:hypothetical protein
MFFREAERRFGVFFLEKGEKKKLDECIVYSRDEEQKRFLLPFSRKRKNII